MGSVPGLPALDNTMGALYIGIVLCMALWGAGTVQMYYYFNNFPKDDWWMKVYVFTVWALDTYHQGLIIHSGYIYLITQYANPLFLGILERSLLDMVIVTAIVCFMVQGFFILRVWRLSHRNYYITGFLTLFVSTQFVATIVYYGKAYHYKTFLELQQVYPISKSINVITACSDVFIAAALIFLLQRSRTGFKRSETVINRLIMFSVNTGLLTALSAIGSLVSVTASPLTFIYISFYLLVCRLYVNSLFATLNARAELRSGVTGDTESGSNSVSLNRLRARQVEISGNGYGLDKSNGHMVSIKVATETSRDDMLKSNVVRDPSESDVEGAYQPPSMNKSHF